MSCPFCTFEPSGVLAQTDSSVALWDRFPVSEGHSLIFPRKHVASVYELTMVEQQDLWKLVATVREKLIQQFGVTAFNIGFNDGLEAGQTVLHAHVHVIPRRPGDVPDPRGGVRWVIADKAQYWS